SFPHNALAAHFKSTGDLEKATAEGEKAVQLLPSSALYRSNLCGGYLRLTMLTRAQDVCESAVRDKLDNTTVHRFLHTIALIRNDAGAVQREEAWRATGTADYANIEFQANIAAISGQLAAARNLYSEAIKLAELAGLADRAAEYRGRFALLEAYFGNRSQAK